MAVSFEMNSQAEPSKLANLIHFWVASSLYELFRKIKKVFTSQFLFKFPNWETIKRNKYLSAWNKNTVLSHEFTKIAM